MRSIKLRKWLECVMRSTSLLCSCMELPSLRVEMIDSVMSLLILDILMRWSWISSGLSGALVTRTRPSKS